MEIGAEAALFPEKEYINGIAELQCTVHITHYDAVQQHPLMHTPLPPPTPTSHITISNISCENSQHTVY